MKILVVAGKDEQGGAPISMQEMVVNLKSAFNVECILLISREGALSNFCKNNNIRYILTGHEPIAIAKGSTKMRQLAKLILRPFYTIRCFVKNRISLLRISNAIELDNIDLVHTNSNRDGIGALLNKKYGINHVWHIREFGDKDYNVVFLLPYSIRFMNRYTTKFIAISDAVKEAWVEKGIEKSKIERVYNGVNVKRIVSDVSRNSLCAKEFKIVMLGTVCPTKGQEQLIKAIGLLPEYCRHNTNVDLYGNCTNDYEYKLKRIINKFGIANHINFLGYTNIAYDILRNYSVGVICSKSEAFGRITPEYMAAGLIVLASDTGANIELIDDEKNGFLYRYGDTLDLSKKIEYIYNMKVDEKLKISKYAEKTAREIFTSENNAKNIYEVYKKIAHK